MLHLFVSVLPLLCLPLFGEEFLDDANSDLLLFHLEHGSLSLDFTVVAVFSLKPPFQFFVPFSTFSTGAKSLKRFTRLFLTFTPLHCGHHMSSIVIFKPDEVDCLTLFCIWSCPMENLEGSTGCFNLHGEKSQFDLSTCLFCPSSFGASLTIRVQHPTSLQTFTATLPRSLDLKKVVK